MNGRGWTDVLALCALAVSGLALVSYVTAWPWIRTWGDPAMAINTATCFVLLSLAVLWRDRGK